MQNEFQHEHPGIAGSEQIAIVSKLDPRTHLKL